VGQENVESHIEMADEAEQGKEEEEKREKSKYISFLRKEVKIR
jgi:hypothetical protein